MAKQIDKVGSSTSGDDKSFKGSGVEGEKGADQEATVGAGSDEDGADQEATVGAGSYEDDAVQEAPVVARFDKEGASHVVTLRDSKAVTVWYRDGKEIGVEDAG